MFSSLAEFFGPEKKLQHNTKTQRSSSLQGSLPTILFATTCIDFEPLSPLTTTVPINVPLSYHDHHKPYSSSLDSLSTSRSNSTNSLASSVSSSLSSSSSSSYGCPTTSTSSSMSDDDLPLAFTTPPPTTTINTSSMEQLSSGGTDRKEKRHHSISTVIPTPIQPATTSKIEFKIITKMALFENFRHSLSLFVGPSFTSMPWTTPPASTTSTITTISACDNIFYEEDDCITTSEPIDDDDDHNHHHHHHHRYPQLPIYTRALRENPAHLRMIVSEVNMMRVNKLISPLRPRAILLERTDPFIPSTPSPLRHPV